LYVFLRAKWYYWYRLIIVIHFSKKLVQRPIILFKHASNRSISNLCNIYFHTCGTAYNSCSIFCQNTSVSFAVSVLSLCYRVVTWEQQNEVSFNWALGSYTKIYWRFIIPVRNQTRVMGTTWKHAWVSARTCVASRHIFTAPIFFENPTCVENWSTHLTFSVDLSNDSRDDSVDRSEHPGTVGAGRTFTAYTFYLAGNSGFATHAKCLSLLILVIIQRSYLPPDCVSVGKIDNWTCSCNHYNIEMKSLKFIPLGPSEGKATKLSVLKLCILVHFLTCLINDVRQH
jgi:hypothetical protein